MFKNHSRNVSDKALVKAAEFAAARNAQNGGNDTAAYAGHIDRLPLTPEQASEFAIVGEIAVADELGLDKNLIEWVIDRADYKAKGLKQNADLRWTHPVTGVEWRFEVRNAAKEGSPLPIKKKDNQDNLIVIQVYVHPDKKNGFGRAVKGEAKPTNKVEYLGWRYGTDYRPESAKHDTDYRNYKYDITTLMEALNNE